MYKAKVSNNFMSVVMLTAATLASSENANAVALLASTAPGAVAGSTALKVAQTTSVPFTRTDAKIRPTCKVTKTGNFDPIVYPGDIEAGHHHTFFGNDAINPGSTGESLKAGGGSTCVGGIANRSSYWVPSLYDSRTGAVKPPSQFLVYYATNLLPNLRASVQRPPDGLKMIAGDHTTGSPGGPPQNSGAIYFECQGQINKNPGVSIPSCNAGSRMRYKLTFPECWDGKNLDSDDHKSHMAQANSLKGNGCPSAHPVRIPSITFIVDYKVAVNGESNYWRLSSDMYDASKPGGLSLHGDLMTAWDPKIMDMIVKNCLRAGKDCGGSLLGADANGKNWALLK